MRSSDVADAGTLQCIKKGPAMNVVRSLMSVFLLILLALSVAGWNWAGGQPSPQAEGARFVLVLCGLTAVGSLWLLWTAKLPAPPEGR